MAKEKEIFNREKYNDGKWHSVSGLTLFIMTYHSIPFKETPECCFIMYVYVAGRSFSVWRRRNFDWL